MMMRIGESYDLKPHHTCPACDMLLDGSTAVCADDRESRRPVAGDVTICVYCATLLAFDSHMKPRRLTRRDLRTLPASLRRRLIRVRDAVKKISKQARH